MKVTHLFWLFLLLLSFEACHARSAIKCPKSQSTYQYDRIILEAAQKHLVDAALIHAVIKQESCYKRFAVSHAGAEGLMQLMPATARRFNVKNSFVAKQNINAGTKYLAWLLKRFKGNVRFALAGYNAGEGKVDRYKGIPPYKETKHYVKVVMANYRRFKGLSSPAAKKRQIILAKAKDRKKQDSGLNGKTRLASKQAKRPSGLHFNKKRHPQTNQQSVVVVHNKRVRIRSITLTKSASRKGYTRIHARKRQEG